MDVCTQCFGVWFDVREFINAMDKFNEGKFDKELNKWREVSAGSNYPDHYWKEDTIMCPLYYSKMKKYDYAGDSKVHIDRCFKCGGFWVDGNEIIKLWEYAKPDMSRDSMGKYLIRVMNEAERERRDC